MKKLINLDLNYIEVVEIAQSVQWLCYGPDDPWFDSRQRQTVFVKISGPTLGFTRPALWWALGSFPWMTAARALFRHPPLCFNDIYTDKFSFFFHDDIFWYLKIMYTLKRGQITKDGYLTGNAVIGGACGSQICEKYLRSHSQGIASDIWAFMAG
jgi:hypothetical protein